MFYHSLPHTPEGQSPPPWWCFHAETLTPLRINRLPKGIVRVTAIDPPPGFLPVFQSHPGTFNHDLVITHLMPELAGVDPHIKLEKVHTLPRAKVNLPAYLPIWDHQGGQPAIIHTVDPMVIILADSKDERKLSTTTPYYRTNVDLSAEGWAYWWEDASLAWDDLIKPFLPTPGSTEK